MYTSNQADTRVIRNLFLIENEMMSIYNMSPIISLHIWFLAHTESRESFIHAYLFPCVQVTIHRRSIDFSGMSTRLGLFYALR